MSNQPISRPPATSELAGAGAGAGAGAVAGAAGAVSGALARIVTVALLLTGGLAACAAPPKATLNDDAMERPALSETVSDLRTRYNTLRTHPWAADQKANFVRAKRWLLRLAACAPDPDDTCRLVARAVDGELLAIHTYLLRRAADASAGIDSRIQEDF